jgi:hypothetical protein
MGNIRNEVLNNLFRSTTNLRAFEELLASLPQQLSGGGSEDDPDVLPPGQGQGQGPVLRMPQASRQPSPAAPPAIQLGGSGTITLSGGFPPQKPKAKPKPPAES